MKFSDIPQFTRFGNWECSYDIESFIKNIEKWEKEENLQLNPDFQRGHVWTEDQQVNYVRFILQGGITAKVVYFNQPGWMRNWEGDFVCVDGLQRITAIKQFVHNEIKIYDHYFNEFEGNPRCFNDLRINVNNLKTRKEVLQWYLQFNSGGTIHTSEELNRIEELLKKED